MLQTKPGRESPPGPPRWVKVFGIAVIILLLLFGLLHLTGDHLGGHTPPTEQGAQPPWP